MDVVQTSMLGGSEENQCRSCGFPPTLAFNWQMAIERNLGHESVLGPGFSVRVGSLKPERRLKWGHLYHCEDCAERWFLDDRKLMMTHVPNDKRQLLDRWDQTRLVPPLEHRQILHAIGGTGPDQYGNNAGGIQVPCKLTKASGECIDPAVVLITRRPPIGNWFCRVALYEDVASVEPSDYALPLEVRTATLSADEICMGFSPTRVEADEGTRFVLNWSASVFVHGNIKGRQIRLARERWDFKDVPIIECDALATFVFADDERLNEAGWRSRWQRWLSGRSPKT